MLLRNDNAFTTEARQLFSHFAVSNAILGVSKVEGWENVLSADALGKDSWSQIHLMINTQSYYLSPSSATLYASIYPFYPQLRMNMFFDREISLMGMTFDASV